MDLFVNIHKLVKSGDLAKVEQFLKKNPQKINKVNSDRQFLLNIAISNKDIKMVKLLLDLGAELNDSSHDFVTMPLEAAIDSKNTEIIQLLLEHSANPFQGDRHKSFLIIHSVYKGKSDDFSKQVIDMILNKGFDMGPTGAELIISCAGHAGSLKMLQYLEEKGLDLNTNLDENSSLLHIAAQHGDNNKMLFLLNKGLDINKTDKEGHTPLHVALHYLDLDSNVIKTLLDNNADVNIRDNKNITPFAYFTLREFHKEGKVGGGFSGIFREKSTDEIANNLFTQLSGDLNKAGFNIACKSCKTPIKVDNPLFLRKVLRGESGDKYLACPKCGSRIAQLQELILI